MFLFHGSGPDSVLKKEKTGSHEDLREGSFHVICFIKNFFLTLKFIFLECHQTQSLLFTLMMWRNAAFPVV